MGKGSAPSAPDPYQSAGAQYEYGTQSAAFNKAMGNTNVVTPTGSTTFEQTGTGYGGAPVYTETQTLSPEQQQILTGQQQLTQQAQGGAASALDSQSKLPSVSDLGDLGSQAQSAAYKTATASMDPYWNQQQEQLDSQLRNAGAHPGDPAYDNAMQAFQANRSSAYGQAENQAFGQGLTAEQQRLGEATTLQQLPINEYSAISSGGQVNPASASGAGSSTTGSGSVQAPDFMGAQNNAYQGQLAQYNSNVASSNADIGALASLAAAFLL